MRLNVLALSGLFPNPVQPNYGIFVLNRLKAVDRLCNVKVVAPIPVYPLLDRALRGRKRGQHVPVTEHIERIEVHHPKYLVIPRFLKWFDALSYFLAVLHVIRGIEREGSFEPDVIDVHWTYPDIVAGCWLAYSRRKKLLVTVRGRKALYPGEVSLRRCMLAYCLRRADVVVALSDELKELVIELGVPADRVRTILNGVDRTGFFARPAAECRQRLGIAAGKSVLVSVGSLIEGKGHHHLVRMMPALSRMRDVQLYIIGGRRRAGDMSATLCTMIAELGLSNVRLISEVDHAALADWYGAADLFCLATRGEGCPNVVLEALACGTPVVCTAVGATRELVTDGVNGFLIEAGRIDQFGPAIDRALSWNWDRKQIADAMDRWGWARCADEVMDTYRSALEARSPGVLTSRAQYRPYTRKERP